MQHSILVSSVLGAWVDKKMSLYVQPPQYICRSGNVSVLQ